MSGKFHGVRQPFVPPIDARCAAISSRVMFKTGKHRMPYQRLKHVAPGMDKKNQSEILPIVIVRDPYNWMQSMVGFHLTVRRVKSTIAPHPVHQSAKVPMQHIGSTAATGAPTLP